MTKTSEDKKRQIVTEFRRSEILDAATKTFSAKGLEASRMDDIAAQAGLAKATVYVYFHSKDEIYEAVVKRALEELFALSEQKVAEANDFAGRLYAFIAVRLVYWREKQELYGVIAHLKNELADRKRSLKWQRIAVDYLVAMFSEAAKSGEIPTQDFEAPAWALMDMVRGIHERRIVQQEAVIDQQARRLAIFVLRGLGASVPQQWLTEPPSDRAQQAAG